MVNVPNRGAVAGLPDHAIVEVPSVIGRAGAAPLAQGRLPQATRGLVQTIKEYEQLTILASEQNSRALALKALAVNPLIPSVHMAEVILDRLAEAHGALWPDLR